MMNANKKYVSEIRRDAVSGDWIVVASGRGKRPHAKVGKRTKQVRQPKGTCPFENPQKSGNPDPVLTYYKNKKKTL